MIRLPDEIRVGQPEEPDRLRHVKAESCRLSRSKTGDSLRLSFSAAEAAKLVDYLRDDRATSDVELGVDAPAGSADCPPVGILPPDPMGPLVMAAYTFAVAMCPDQKRRGDPQPDDYLLIATTLFAQLTAGLSFGPISLPWPLQFPKIPVPNNWTDNEALNNVLTVLSNAVNAAAQAIGDVDVDTATNPAQLNALATLRATVRTAFS